jgi:hypothetical protein
MNWSKGIGKAHRWLLIIFTLTVLVNFTAMALGPTPPLILYPPLPLLFPLLFVGLCLFVLPYGRRSGRRTGA